MVDVVVPSDGGAELVVVVPGGARVQVAVPRGLQPGDVFQVAVPHSVMSQAKQQLRTMVSVVPSGVSPGESIAVQLRSGFVLEVTVPNGVGVGDSFEFAAPPLSSSPKGGRC